MNIGIYGLLIVFAAFIILLIINPNLSCFGKRLKSPFYPLLRKKKLRKRAYGRPGHPADGTPPGEGPEAAKKPSRPAEDYGFHLDD